MPFGVIKLEWCGYAVVKKNSKISLFVLTESTSVTDTRTDTCTHTHTACIASRGKNTLCCAPALQVHCIRLIISPVIGFTCGAVHLHAATCPLMTNDAWLLQPEDCHVLYHIDSVLFASHVTFISVHCSAKLFITIKTTPAQLLTVDLHLLNFRILLKFAINKIIL